MIGLLADHDVERHADLIWRQFAAADWAAMKIASLQWLADIGLSTAATDRDIWLFCQQSRMLLVTANRNMQGGNSLEAVIRELGTAKSLPVLTNGDRDRVVEDATYRELCAYRIADIAIELDAYLGVTRLFIP